MQMALEKASNVDLIRSFANLTVEKIAEGSYPSFGALTKVHGLAKVENVSSMLFLDLSATFNDELSPEQVQELSVEISSGIFRNLSLEDIYLVCRKIKKKKNHKKLNVNFVLLALEEHFDEKCEAVLKHNINQDHAKRGVIDNERTASKELEKLDKNRAAHRRHYTETIKKQSK